MRRLPNPLRARPFWLIQAVLVPVLVLVIVLNAVPRETRGGAVSARVLGPGQIVFDWSRDACEPGDIPDLPARAFRDYRGRVQLTIANPETRLMVGPDLNRLRHSCRVVMKSSKDPRPSRFADREWLAAPYTTDGKRVVALVHNEYQGHLHRGRCKADRYQPCWYNSVTLARSRNGGKSYVHARAPGRHLVAGTPYRYPGGAGPIGAFGPSNIVRNNADRYYYVLLRMRPYQGQPGRICALRTARLGQPKSWRAWNGERFAVRFADPYRSRLTRRADHICQAVSPKEIGGEGPLSLSFNTFLGKYILVNASATRDTAGRLIPGFYLSLSDDLIHWSKRTLIMRTELARTFRCGDRNPATYPSILDPNSTSRNFETTGKRAYLYFTRFHNKACRRTFNRDLVRVPVEFGS